jgi:hypothetical protein
MTFNDFKTYALSKGYEDRDLKLEWEKMENWLEANPKRKVKVWKNFWLNWLKNTKSDPLIVRRLQEEKENKEKEAYFKKIENEKCQDPSFLLKKLAEKLKM